MASGRTDRAGSMCVHKGACPVLVYARRMHSKEYIRYATVRVHLCTFKYLCVCEGVSIYVSSQNAASSVLMAALHG